jgi:thymidylate synthase/deoxyadenosine/deoxycytidine kinase
MNIVLSGMDACGKSTLANKLRNKYNMNYVHLTSKNRNDLNYHLDLIDTHENTVFDRFSVGEMIFPRLYNREPKMTHEEFYETLKRIKENNDIYIIFNCSNVDILKERLIARGEEKVLDEIEDQCKLYKEVADDMKNYFNGYKNFYICDIAEEDCYNKLDNWIDEHYGKVTINVAYRKLARQLYEYGHVMETRNVRGNTKELCNYMLTIDDLDSDYITLKTGKTNLTYLAAELLWYWSSRNDTAFIGKFAKLWEKLSDDGITNNSAYGYVLKEKHGFNQIEKIIELLKVDPYSRRAVLNINVPNENVINTKDEPCTICLDYQIRNGKLHSTCIMRSNDFNFGLRNDIGFFVLLQKYIAKQLGVSVGSYTHFAMSIHFYDRDEAFVKNIAYGTLEEAEEKLNINELINNSEELCLWIDNKFTNKDDFTKLLKEKKIIY